MEISLKIENLQAVREVLDKLSGQQARVAYAKALNDTAYQVGRDMKDEMRRVFDRPTSYILNSVFVDQATADKLSARIAPNNKRMKAGVDPQKILRAQEDGGTRRDKRSEVALRRHGFLPQGYQSVIPATPFPGSDDGHGNMRGQFMVQLLSYLRLMAEQGSTSNMTKKRKRDMGRGTAKLAGRRYFIAGGRTTMVIEGGTRAVMRTGSAGRSRHLAPGIWAELSSGGLLPVLLFVRAPKYKPLLSMERVAKATDVQAYLEKKLRYQIRQAAGV